MVLCVDEKSQIQALNRTQPVLPMRPAPRRAPTTTSATAPRACTPPWIWPPARSSARCMPATAPRSSWRSCRRSTPKSRRAGLPRRARQRLHAQDSGGEAWLTNHPPVRLHFTPTTRSWLNLVERWFAELTTKKLRRGTQPGPPTQHRHPRLDRHLERRPPALRLDQDRRPNPRIHRQLLHTKTTQDTSIQCIPAGQAEAVRDGAQARADEHLEQHVAGEPRQLRAAGPSRSRSRPRSGAASRSYSASEPVRPA